MDFAHSEPSFQAERIHDLPQGQLGAGPEGARPAARQELHEAEGAAPRRPARALASLPGRSEAEHPGAAGGEIWAGHHERSLTGEKQRKSWGPATQEPRGNHAGDGETAGSYNTGTHSGVGEGPPATSLRTGACAPGPATLEPAFHPCGGSRAWVAPSQPLCLGVKFQEPATPGLSPQPWFPSRAPEP